MTRAGEKLYGDWEKRASRAARPFAWRRIAKNVTAIVATIVLGALAMFGFSY